MNYSAFPQPTLYQIKSYYVFETKIFLRRYTEIHGICFQSALRMEFLGVKKWWSATVFFDTKQNMFAGKFVKSIRFLAALREHIILNIK